MADLALRHVKTYAPDFVHLARGLGLPGSDSLPQNFNAIGALQQELESPDATRSDAWLAYTVYRRMLRNWKLKPLRITGLILKTDMVSVLTMKKMAMPLSTAKAMADGLLEGSLPPLRAYASKH